MKLNLSPQKLPISFTIAILIHLLVFITIGFQFSSSEIPFIDSSEKNLITFDLNNINFSNNTEQIKGIKSLEKKLPRMSAVKDSNNVLPSDASVGSDEKSKGEDASTSDFSVANQNEKNTGEGLGTGYGSASNSEGVFQGAVANYTEPTYPPIAIKRNLQGTAIIKINLHSSGEMQSYEILQSTGHSVLDNAVIDAIKKWKFKAHPKGVAYYVKKTVVFVLK